jgi:hypothetical protein
MFFRSVDEYSSEFRKLLTMEASEAPGDKVRMTFRVVLSRQDAETLAARAIQEEKNLETLVGEILEAAARKGKA